MKKLLTGNYWTVGFLKTFTVVFNFERETDMWKVHSFYAIHTLRYCFYSISRVNVGFLGATMMCIRCCGNNE